MHGDLIPKKAKLKTICPHLTGDFYSEKSNIFSYLVLPDMSCKYVVKKVEPI